MFDLVHQIDLAIWFFGPAYEVFAGLDKRSNLDIKADDFANLVLVHKNGISGQIQLDMVSPSYRGENEIITNKDVFHFNLVNGKLIKKRKKINKVIFEVSKKFDRNDLFVSQMKYFLKRLVNNELKPSCSLSEGIHSLNVLLAAKLDKNKKLIKVRENFERYLCYFCCGSKGLPNKNIRNLYGKPLIAWSILQALQVPDLDRVVVSTDSDEIASIAREYGAETPFKRPSNLALDETGKFSVFKHAFENCKSFYKKDYEFFLDLDCTNPLRDVSDISSAIKKYRKLRPDGIDGIFSICSARKIIST